MRFIEDSRGERVSTDNEVKLTKVFRPSRLSAVQDFGGGKVFQVLVVGDYVYRV